MTADTTRGEGPWGTDTPQDEGQARDRLLTAAEVCYAQRGVARTTIVDIAREAGVHHSTVYAYFQSKDDVLAACFVRSMGSVLDAAEPCYHTDQPFLEQLIRATVVGLTAARLSPTVMLLLGTTRSAHLSRRRGLRTLAKNLVENIGQRITAAVTAGEVRDDVAVETMARWVTRVAFSLIQEPGSPEDGGDEAVLRAFLPGALSPRT